MEIPSVILVDHQAANRVNGVMKTGYIASIDYAASLWDQKHHSAPNLRIALESYGTYSSTRTEEERQAIRQLSAIILSIYLRLLIARV
ncbi:hypothetical protein O9992_24165 [Vibrio lentus]|nr:hypothetical protein [Vibrio lentus]